MPYHYANGLTGAELAPCQDWTGKGWHLLSNAPLIDPPFRSINHVPAPLAQSARYYVVLPQHPTANAGEISRALGAIGV